MPKQAKRCIFEQKSFSIARNYGFFFTDILSIASAQSAA
jgi:hypothetical protein